MQKYPKQYKITKICKTKTQNYVKLCKKIRKIMQKYPKQHKITQNNTKICKKHYVKLCKNTQNSTK